MIRRSLLLVLAMLTVLVPAPPAWAQATELGRQTLGRPYWFVFLAYAIVVVLIAGWTISIARRLARVEARLPDQDA
jgi:CcmD family protein